MLRWSQVETDEMQLTAEPVVSYLTNIQAKNLDLQGYLEALQDDPKSVNINMITMQIQGVILAAVNGGISELQTKFINDQYREENPDHEDYIQQLIMEIKKQNIYVEGLLELHGRLLSSDLEDLQNVMEEEFAKRKESVRQLYGPDVDRTFKIPILDKMSVEKVKETTDSELLTIP